MCSLARRRRARSPSAPACRAAPSAAAVDLEMALKLLSLPREVGRTPRTASRSVAGIGRFGAYVQHGKTYANLEAGDDVLNIGLNRAVALIADKVARGPARDSAPIPAARSAITPKRAGRCW